MCKWRISRFMEDVGEGGGGGGLGGRKQAKTKFSLFLNLSAVPKKSTPTTNFEKNASSF